MPKKGVLGITIKANNKATPGVRKAQEALVSFGKKAAIGVAGVTAAAPAATAALFKMAEAAADAADKAFVAADRIGTSAEFISRMEFAAGQAGNTSAELATALTALTRRAAAMPKTFEKWGVSVRDSNGNIKDTQTLALEVADRMRSLGSAAERSAMAQDLMSESGRKLVPVFQAGSEGLREMWKESDRLGHTISTTEAVIGNQFSNTMNLLERAIAGAARSLGSVFIPHMTAFAEQAVKIVAKVREWADANKAAINDRFVGALEWISTTALPNAARGFNVLHKTVVGMGVIVDLLKTGMVEFLKIFTVGFDQFLEKLQQIYRFIGADFFANSLSGARRELGFLNEALDNAADGFVADMKESLKSAKEVDKLIDKIVKAGQGGLNAAIARTGSISADARINAGLDRIAGGGEQPGGGFSPAAPRSKADKQIDVALYRLQSKPEVVQGRTVRGPSGTARVVSKEMMKLSRAAQATNRIMSTAADQVAASFVALAFDARNAKEALASLAKGLFQQAAGTLLSVGLKAAIGLNKGGFVPGSGNRDTVPAMLTPGEYVLPRSVVKAIRMGQPPEEPGMFASGGLVGAGAAGGTTIVNQFNSIAPQDSAFIMRQTAQFAPHLHSVTSRGRARIVNTVGGRLT